MKYDIINDPMNKLQMQSTITAQNQNTQIDSNYNICH